MARTCQEYSFSFLPVVRRLDQVDCTIAEFILERRRVFFFYRFLCEFPFFFFLCHERLTDRSISKRYPKSDIATRVQLQKSSTSRAFHARDTGFYFIASSGV